VTAHRIQYEGPASFAVRAATLLADADGVELVSSQPPERRGDGDAVALALTVEAAREEVERAVDEVRAMLPPEATLELAEPDDGEGDG
jgi:hypothetical protein